MSKLEIFFILYTGPIRSLASDARPRLRSPDEMSGRGAIRYRSSRRDILSAMVAAAAESGVRRGDAGRRKADECESFSRQPSSLPASSRERGSYEEAMKLADRGGEIAPNMEILSLSNRAIWERGKKCKEAVDDET